MSLLTVDYLRPFSASQPRRLNLSQLADRKSPNNVGHDGGVRPFNPHFPHTNIHVDIFNVTQTCDEIQRMGKYDHLPKLMQIKNLL